jgi:GMP synthase-like glutamine amidotransferase
MRVHILQHVAFEGPGSIGAWLKRRGATVTYTHFYRDATLLPLDDVDFVIALGGPMSVNDERELPWLVAEKRFIREAIAAGKIVLGICLGGQLIASALGARVYRNEEREIGWFPIYAEPQVVGTFVFPREANVFHWHGETFDLPPGAVLLARSEACKHQAFQIGRRVIGLQCHLETVLSSAEDITAGCAGELLPGGRWVQSAEHLRAVAPEEYARINVLMDEALDYLALAPRLMTL